MTDTHLLLGGFSVRHHGAERIGICSVNIPRVSIAVDKRGCRTKDKRNRGLGVYGKLTIVAFAALANGDLTTLLGPSKICHSVLLLGVLSKLLMVEPPKLWVMLIRKPASICLNQRPAWMMKCKLFSLLAMTKLRPSASLTSAFLQAQLSKQSPLIVHTSVLINRWLLQGW